MQTLGAGEVVSTFRCCDGDLAAIINEDAVDKRSRIRGRVKTLSKPSAAWHTIEIPFNNARCMLNFLFSFTCTSMLQVRIFVVSTTIFTIFVVINDDEPRP